MAWAKATIEIRPASVGTGIKAVLRQAKRSAAYLSFTVSESVGKQLGWSDKDGIEIMIGEGEHHGLIRMRKNKSAAQITLERRDTGKGGWYSLKLGHQSAFVDRTESPAWCQWEKVEDGWVEIVLPKWADETAPRKPGGATAPKPSAAAAKVENTPFLRKQSVTASLMGDPPPGRRQMLEKVGKMAAE